MIRRKQIDGTGRAFWVLISQVEHARVAGELAEQWGNPPLMPLVPRNELVATIHHHDDGWAEWERMPDVDPQLGQPYAFTEMPLADSLAIWRKSIDRARSLGNLAPYLVSGHFSALLRHSNAWQKSDTPATPLAQAFLTEQDRLRGDWLQAWQMADAANTPQIAERGLHALQFFDALSLWLCCAERTDPHKIDAPDGTPLTFTPALTGEIAVAPWPFTIPELRLKAPGQRIVEDFYPTARALAEALHEPVTIAWRVVPAK